MQHEHLCAVCVDTIRVGCQHPRCDHGGPSGRNPLTEAWVPTVPGLARQRSAAPTAPAVRMPEVNLSADDGGEGQP